MPARNSLPRKASLKKRSEIELLLSEGSRLSCPYLAVRWRRAERFSQAVLVSRRHGNAVCRNRIKRRMREVIRLSPVSHQPVALLILPRHLQTEPPFATLSEAFNRLAAAIG